MKHKLLMMLALLVCTTTAWAQTTLNLSTVTNDITVADGTTLTGHLDAANNPVQISIAAGATVTLSGATIDGEEYIKAAGDEDWWPWSGLTCLGDATIILADGTTNTITSFHRFYNGIHVPFNASLTIRGTGTLVARCFDQNGSGRAAGIGGRAGQNTVDRDYNSCGDIIIEGGTITATGGYLGGAGIGAGTDTYCGKIIIKGGTVTATGGHDAAGIGVGSPNSLLFGNIIITKDVTRVTASSPTPGTGSIVCRSTVSAAVYIGGTVDNSGNLVGGVTGDITADAVTLYPYTVHFDANGGTGSMADQTLMNGVSAELTAGTFARDGYLFAGWNTAADGSGTSYADGQSVSNMTETSGATVTLYAKWAEPDEYFANAGHAGTPEDPYLISSESHWETLCDNVNAGITYSGKHFKMTADIGSSQNPVTTMVGGPRPNSSDYYTFNGTFDGDGHTLTVSYTNVTSDWCAPFAFTYGATIKNLATAGTITSFANYAGGVVGRNGTAKLTLTNVKSSVHIQSYATSTAIFGGLVGWTINADLTGCVFTGEMVGVDNTTRFGGLVGWKTDTNGSVLNLKHCLFDPSRVSIVTSNSQPFAVNNGQMTSENCYVLSTVFGTGQGPQARSISAGTNVTVSPVGEATAYDVSGITVYGDNLGLVYNNGTTTTFYAGQGVTLPVNLAYTAAVPEHHVVLYAAANATVSGDANPYSLTLDDNGSAAVTISASTTLRLQGSGTEAEPYLIGTCADWDLLATNVNQGTTTYSGQYVELVSDLSFESSPFQMVGVSTDKCFRGTFNGKGHTISVTLIDDSSNDFCAPFRFINGTTIKYLHVEGSILKSRGKNAAGFVGQAKGVNYIIGCRSSVIIDFNKDGDVSSGGFIGELRGGGTTYLSDCTFDGRLRGTDADHWGGFIGWVASGQTANLKNCLFAPQEVSVNNSGNSTFARRDGTVDLANCYYKTQLGTAQGTNASSMTDDQLIAALGGWEVLNGKIVPAMKEYTFAGAGTQQSPYQITSADDWKHLAGNVALGNSYSEQYLLLTADISVSRMIGTDTPAGAHLFAGTFNGGGHTLTFTSTNIGEYNAPFRYVNGATIENLHVDGTITTADIHAAGVVGRVNGATTVKNCISSVTISSTVNGDGLHGGFIANILKTGTAHVEGCRFDGRLLGTNTTRFAGFVGDVYYASNSDHTTAYLKNCYFCPAETNIGSGEGGSSFSYSFVYSYPACYTLNNCFYQNYIYEFYQQGGKQALTFEGSELLTVAFAGEGDYYSLLDATFYPGGFEAGGTLYGGCANNGAGENVSINLTLNPAYSCTGYKVLIARNNAESTLATITGTANPYTLKLEGGENLRIEPKGVTFKALSGAGTEGNPYLIEYREQWELLSTMTTAGKYFKLMINLDNVTTMVDAEFAGTFDGDGHTITIAYGSADNYLGTEYVAPFRYAKGAVIKNLHVAGDIYTNDQYAAGIIGKSTVDATHPNTITNCRSSVTIHSNTWAYGFHGGLVACNEGVPSEQEGGALNIIGCLFDGSFIYGTKSCGGFVGSIGTYVNQSINIQNCLFKPAAIDLSDPSTDYNTFVYTSKKIITLQRSYYTQAFGDEEGIKAYVLTAQPANLGAAETAYNVSGITAYENGLGQDGKYYIGTIGLYNVQSNADLISDIATNYRSENVNVTLQGRTLYKDGNWNTLCLPFDVTDLEGTPLEGATLMELGNSDACNTGFDASTGTLNLQFVPANQIEAGHAYIVKWTSGSNIENPVFNGVTVENKDPANQNVTSRDGKVTFSGTYTSTTFTEENKSILFLGEASTLYYPQNGASIGTFRAYFTLNLDGSNVKAFVLNFGEEIPTGLTLNPSPEREGSAGAWYTVDGRRLSGKPAQRGIYVNNGRKVVVK